MSTPTTIKDLVERNKLLAYSFKPKPYLSELQSAGLPPPKILIITCADPRCVPEQFLGLKGIEAVVFRNVCGHIVPNLHLFLALDIELHFEEIMVVHHTGMILSSSAIEKVETN